MTTPYPPYPPAPPRKLERSKTNRMLGGVCAGLASYLNMDVTLVRVLTVLISLFTGLPIILYIVALFVIPEEGSTPPSDHPSVTGQQAPPPYAAPDPVWGPAGAPWEQPQAAPAPGPTGPPPAGPGAMPPTAHQPPEPAREEHSPGDSTEPGDTREPR